MDGVTTTMATIIIFLVRQPNMSNICLNVHLADKHFEKIAEGNHGKPNKKNTYYYCCVASTKTRTLLHLLHTSGVMSL